MVGRLDARLGNAEEPTGQAAQQLDLAPAVDLEGRQVAGVDADDRRSEIERPLQLGACVHLDERLHLEILGSLDEVGREVVLDECEQHENRIRTVDARFGDLPHVDEEVLAQHRQVDGRAPRRSSPGGPPPPATSSVAAALSAVASAAGPCSPPSTASEISALRSGSPPARSESVHSSTPSSRASSSLSVTTPSRTVARLVAPQGESSSMPGWPWTTMPYSQPSCASAWAMGST